MQNTLDTMFYPTKQESLSIVVKNIARFSTSFYKTASKDEESNFICSPISASIALAMTAFGARNKTEKEMRSVLQFCGDDEVNKLGYQLLVDTFNAFKNVQLNIANKMFVSNSMKVHCPYISVTKDFFRSELQLVNFGECETARKIINEWCENKTNKTIKDILQPGDIKPLTRLAIVNAIYFKGGWLHPFDEEETDLKPFYINNETQTDVLMMQQEASFNFGKLKKLDAKFVELPYESNSVDDAMSMFIILPNKNDGLKIIEENLDQIDFRRLHDQPKRKLDAYEYRESVLLKLPKFKIESTIQLKNILKEMGMIEMFDEEKADFSGVTDNQIFVDKVIQKAFIEVNEKGSEAAAATVVAERSRCGADHRIIVDRPFFCVIVATKTGTQLFNARVVDPSNGSS
ncbi:serpin B8-like [Aphidius gifuensis]|uniref:serpin B8-like n=1 Tax=Aphidius gifuensis TaxID=684658 RepID=UPI001CDCE009|nr:serpin B8-like [Aphidius gifuensis]